MYYFSMTPRTGNVAIKRQERQSWQCLFGLMYIATGDSIFEPCLSTHVLQP